MSALEKYNELKVSHDVVVTELQELYIKQTKLNKQQAALFVEIILEEDLLNDEPWEMVINNSTNIWLDSGDCCNDAGEIVIKRTKLFRMLGSTNWGTFGDFDYRSEKLNITIRGGDGEVRIGFIDPTKTIETIKKLGIVVNYSKVMQKAKEAILLAKLYTDVMNSIEKG